MDVERYRERRRETLEEMAWRFAERVRRTGRPVALRPMSSAERRIIHTTLAQDSGITTHSEGEDPERRVVIAPRGGSSAAPAEPTPPARLPESPPQTPDESTP